MQCPCLRKMNVKFCGLNRRTMIPLSDASLAPERCSGPQYRSCPLLQDHQDELPAKPPCPYLSVADVYYCDVAPTRKLIPCNQTTNSRCTGDGHRYCQLYLAVADPRSDDVADSGPTTSMTEDAKLPMPPKLAFAPNHLWLDRGDGSSCHLGVDAFFTRALGRIDAVSYPYHRDECRPVVRFTVNGAAFDLEFPNPIRCTEVNAHLVVDPTEVLRDPYGRGWIFAGIAPANGSHGDPGPLENGMRRGLAARLWMDRERARLNDFAHRHDGHHQHEDLILMQDGGECVSGLSDHLDPGTIHRLSSMFFTWPGKGSVA